MSSKSLIEAIAALVIFLALAGLGMFKVPSDAPTVEAGLRAQAEAILADVPQSLTLEVTGREITVSGDMPSQTERRALEAALRDIPGVEDVTSDLRVLPRVARFGFALRTGDAPVLSGHVVNGATRDRLGTLIRLPLWELAQARGAPFETWDAAVLDLTEAALGLAEAEVTLSASGARLSGTAVWQPEADAVAARLADWPHAPPLTLALTAIDDGAPFLLVAERHPRRGVDLQGKLPPGLTVDAIAGAFATVQTNDLVVGRADPGRPHLATAMRGAVAVLAAAERGTVLVSDGAVVIRALRGGDEMQAAITALRAALPDRHLLEIEELPAEDPEPFHIALERSEGAVRGAGVLPKEGDIDDIAARLDPNADLAGLRLSPYPDLLGWLAGLDTVLDVFPEVREGTLVLEEQTVTLDAELADPEAAARVDARLAALPQAETFLRSVTLQDDGQRLDAVLRYRPEAGLEISGTLPAGVTAAIVAQELGLPAPADAPRTGKVALPRTQDVLAAVAPWLGEAEAVDLTLSPEGITLEAVLSPGVDLPLILPGVEAALTDQDKVAMRLLSDLPPQGTERDNRALGLRQVFLAGYWLPVLEFEPSVAECARQTALAVAREPVGFVTGGARVDARSIRGVNLLAAVARVCSMEAAYAVTVEGHTDSIGDARYNRRLSADRAEAVAQELVKRGVPQGLVRIEGYGEARPVADNSTAAGQALNRRITLAWENLVQGFQ